MSNELVCVVGSWHLACIYAAGMAELGATVVQCDDNNQVIERLKHCEPPLFEPGLAELIAKHQATGRLSFSTDIKASVSRASIVYLADDIKVENNQPDVAGVHRRFDTIVPALSRGAILVVSTQVPVGTLAEFAKEFGPRAHDGLRLAYHPEFLRLGAAVRLFLSPDYIVLGHNDEASAKRVLGLFDKLTCPKVLMGLADGEMVKHAVNAYVAVSVSFASEIGRLADRLGVDTFNVGRALRNDRRVGPAAYILPGIGFTGGNLDRDIGILQTKARAAGVATDMLDAVLAVNAEQSQVPFHLLTKMVHPLLGSTIAIWGLAYKADSSSIRGSYAISLAQAATGAGATVRGFDPYVEPSEVTRASSVVLGEDRYELCRSADVLVIMNDAKLYVDCDFDRLAAVMKQRRLIDPYGILNADRATAAGFHYATIGRGYTIRSPRN